MPYFYHFVQSSANHQKSKSSTSLCFKPEDLCNNPKGEVPTEARKSNSSSEFARIRIPFSNMYGKQVKCGYLLHYKKRVVGRNWTEKIVVLYSDSRLAWFREGQSIAEESILLSDAPELLAAGQWVWRIPRPPSLPSGACPKLAIACGTSVRERAHWFLCHSQDDLIDWMKAINSTLPLPPPPPELYPATIKPLDPVLLAQLESLCQESFSMQHKSLGIKLLGSCCTDSNPRIIQPSTDANLSSCSSSQQLMTLQPHQLQSQSLAHDSSDKNALVTISSTTRPEMQILRTRKPSNSTIINIEKSQEFSRKSQYDSRTTPYKTQSGGEEMMMMAGTSTDWEWGWGSGGGWLCGADSSVWCDTCSMAGPGMDQVGGTMDDEPDCELGDTDVGADFGDFGF